MSELFLPDHLLASLRPLSEATPLSQVEQAYRQFYGFAPVDAALTRVGWFEVDAYRIAAQVWWPATPRATLLLLHGYYDHSALYRHVVQWGLEMGFAVLAVDLPGHGLSSGPRASINDFAEYQAVLRGALGQAEALGLPQPWHLCGQSTGGAILIDYLLNGRPLDAVGETILLAPLVRPRRWGWSQLSYRLLRRFVDEIPRRFSDNSSDADFLEFLRHRDPLQPRMLPTTWVGALSQWVPRIEGAPRSTRSPLIVQGEADMTVDWRHNLGVLQNKFATPRILRLPEARHHLANEVQPLRQRYFDFLGEQLG
ncbi:phospholipase BipL [Phytopseudomonas dryadis]|uniref:Alpha/beta hydrolase n=1 Tax=Phytopseudomonas dryadis TaxID=2487520 RepID=A0ABY1Z5P2_9GAMM|nr:MULTISPECIES: alpha/beta hydrolase [Pseudomonas]TBV03050.1 alpha/beta hydrolase [Pseudomonas dryadis]TBV17673.1 alpha/beta hydrolase [Pseudomonas sp. FRB 230]